MMQERRDHRRRAEAMRLIVECLTGHNNGITIHQLLALHYTLSAAAAERIVKRLAIMGLARERAAGSWSATPPLRHPAQLVGGN